MARPHARSRRSRPWARSIGPRWACVIASALLAMTLPVSARAQPGRSEPVLLIVRPRVGDTLRLQMDQLIEISGRKGATRSTSPLGAGKPPASARVPGEPEYGPRRPAALTRITKLVMYAHSLVESSDLTVTTLLATTDSMAVWAGSGQKPGKMEPMELPPDGRQTRVRVTPDGAMRVSDPPPGAMELGATLASMPGMLPGHPVLIGDRWECDIALPAVGISGFRADGVVHAKFRLDSLTRGGRDAWISLEGTLTRDGAAREMPAGMRMITAGTLRGLLVVDRARAWIIDARVQMDVQSEVAPGPAGPAMPMLLDMHIEQRVRIK